MCSILPVSLIGWNAITIGGQDLTADMNIVYTPDGAGIDFARKRIIMAAKASHIDVIDTVFPDVNDEEGLRRETEYAKKIGFTGKAVINPRQIENHSRCIYAYGRRSQESLSHCERI